MSKLQFIANPEQWKAMEALAYWIADVNYISERYGAEDPEHERAHKTVLMWFEELDILGVPFWVQNTVICWAENWRQYKEQYFVNAMKEKNIVQKGGTAA